MTPRVIALTYLSALERGDLPALLALFQPGAIVHSPLYGPAPATDFYPRLLADTGNSKLHLRGVTEGEHLVGIWFRFDWKLPSGADADFECVDILQLNDQGRIEALHIFYDTVNTRQAFEQETGGSWRPSGNSGLAEASGTEVSGWTHRLTRSDGPRGLPVTTPGRRAGVARGSVSEIFRVRGDRFGWKASG